MRYLYYCNSAYQLLNALNLNWQRKYNHFENIEDYHGDVMILDSFSGAKEISEKVVTEFENVYYIRHVINKGIFHPLKSLTRIVNPEAYLNASGIQNSRDLKNKYDCIVCTKFSKAPAAVWQLNRDCKLSLYEDGMSSYNDHISLDPGSLSYKKLYKVFNRNRIFYDFDHLYLNVPDLYDGKYRNKIIKIPQFNKDYLKKVHNILCDSSNTDNYDLYWLGQYHENEVNKETLDAVSKYANKVIYRPHPRYPKKIDGIVSSTDKTIWELKLLDINDLPNKCFLTINSTAVFSPKILYGEEPYIIFTDRILNKDDNTFQSVINNLIKIYSNPNKIKVPSNGKELQEAIDEFFNHVHQ